jgi:RHS repeat-associated protein
MLVAVERPDGDVVTFAYDALGRRIGKTYRGKSTHWIWDGNVPLHEWVTLSEEALARDGVPLRSSGERQIALAKRAALLARRSAQGPPTDGGTEAEPEIPLLEGTAESPITWLFEPESFAPLAKLVSDERYAIVTDHLGTPRALYDERGREAWAAEIDTYGQLREVRGPQRACPFRFPGQYEDAETGLYYNRFRYYDPESGGYVSQDPIGLAGGKALYAYVGDPLIWADPRGLSKGCTSVRQEKMLDEDVGYNISPEEWFKQYSHLGRYGTFVTDKRAFKAILGHARAGRYTVGAKAGEGRVSRQQVKLLEAKLGLEPGSLGEGFRLTRVDGIGDMAPRSPLTGNVFFKGPGEGLPGGGPEIVVDSIPTS